MAAMRTFDVVGGECGYFVRIQIGFIVYDIINHLHTRFTIGILEVDMVVLNATVYHTYNHAFAGILLAEPAAAAVQDVHIRSYTCRIIIESYWCPYVDIFHGRERCHPLHVAQSHAHGEQLSEAVDDTYADTLYFRHVTAIIELEERVDGVSNAACARTFT